MKMIEFFYKQFSKTLASDGMNDKQMHCLKYVKFKNYESILKKVENYKLLKMR